MRSVASSCARKSELLHSFHALLKAFSLFEKDVDYVVQEGKVVIVAGSPSTGKDAADLMTYLDQGGRALIL